MISFVQILNIAVIIVVWYGWRHFRATDLAKIAVALRTVVVVAAFRA
jgi:hypothetical protein